jgi:hypothetical protein
VKVVKNANPYNGERLLDYDPYSDVKTFFSADGKYGERFAIRQEFGDVSPEVDASRELQKDDDHWKKGVKNGWLHAAHIPDSILLQWHAMGVNINEPKELLRMVQRPEYHYLRCVDKVLV